MDQPTPNTLTRELAERAAFSLYEIHRIEGSQDTKSAEDTLLLKSTKAFLTDVLYQHANEFLGSWLAVSSEYEPLVHAFAALQRRAAGINAMRLQQQAEQAHHAQAQAEEASKVDKSVTISNTGNLDRNAIRAAVAKATNVIVMPDRLQ